MITDVGCGHNPVGDVNVDLFVEATPHRSGDQSKCDDRRLDTKRIPNFVMADACHLPFRDNVFDVVFSSQTIEHVNDPFLMLKEMARISKRRIIIKCPHRFAPHKLKPLHVNRFNITWFEDAAKKLRLNVISKRVSSWRSIPHAYIPIVSFPQEITMVFVKSIQK